MVLPLIVAIQRPPGPAQHSTSTAIATASVADVAAAGGPSRLVDLVQAVVTVVGRISAELACCWAVVFGFATVILFSMTWA